MLAIFVGNELMTGERGSTPAGSVLDLGVEALFLLPILYAAMNFGVAGSLLTGGWVTILIVAGDIAVDLGGGHLPEAESDLTMILILDAVAVFVGWRMAVEQSARDRYWDLFNSNDAPVLIVSAAGVVREANAAACAAFCASAIPRAAPSGGALAGRALEQLVGSSAALLLAGISAPVSAPAIGATYRAAPSRLRSPRGEPQLQIAFSNLTEQMRREEEAAAYARHVVAAQEDERRRVAQELHDGPVQRLIHLCRTLDLAEEHMDPGAGARAEVEGARHVAELIVAELRNILRGLRPPALEHLGLVPTLGRLLDELRERAGIRTRLEVHGAARRLDGELELALFRVGQEALSNVEHHAAASSVLLVVGFSDATVSLTVRDDGIGFDDSNPRADAGQTRLGLRGMAERVQLIGGMLRIRTASGQGTEVAVTVPLPGPGAPRRERPSVPRPRRVAAPMEPEADPPVASLHTPSPLSQPAPTRHTPGA